VKQINLKKILFSLVKKTFIMKSLLIISLVFINLTNAQLNPIKIEDFINQH